MRGLDHVQLISCVAHLFKHSETRMILPVVFSLSFYYVATQHIVGSSILSVQQNLAITIPKLSVIYNDIARYHLIKDHV